MSTNQPTVVVERDITATPGRVWNVITDVESWPRSINSIAAIERLDGGNGFEVGTRWRETRRVMRREGTEEMWVTNINPGESYSVEAENHGIHYVTTFTVSPAANGSRLAVEFSGEHLKPPGLFSRLMARLGMKAVRRGLEMDLADIAAAAERSTT